MDLFNQLEQQPHNLLPTQGTVYYYGQIMPSAKADQFYAHLLQYITWENDQANMFGQQIVTKRKVAWYGEQPFQYTYSNTTKTALPWTKALLTIKARIEHITQETYNACLLNLYHDGSEGMAWHSDGERDLKEKGAIASLSLGAERKFSFKHKSTKQNVSLFLQHGSLLVMKGSTQTHWLHRLPPTTTVSTPRINLTFRTIVK